MNRVLSIALAALCVLMAAGNLNVIWRGIDLYATQADTSLLVLSAFSAVVTVFCLIGLLKCVQTAFPADYIELDMDDMAEKLIAARPELFAPPPLKLDDLTPEARRALIREQAGMPIGIDPSGNLKPRTSMGQALGLVSEGPPPAKA